MSRTRLARALIWKEVGILRRDKRFLLFLFIVPSVLALLLNEGIGVAAAGQTGPDLVVPGFTVMFGFYITTYLGISHYREHAWGAWTMVRVAGLPKSAMALGVVLPYLALGILQMAILLSLGVVILGATMNGSILALVLMILSTEIAVLAIAMTLLNLTSSLTALQQVNQLIVLLLGAIGGALLPVDTMPGWSQPLARLTPQFWSVQGLQSAMSGEGSVADVAPNVAVLLGIGFVALAVGFGAFDATKARRMPLR